MAFIMINSQYRIIMGHHYQFPDTKRNQYHARRANYPEHKEKGRLTSTNNKIARGIDGYANELAMKDNEASEHLQYVIADLEHQVEKLRQVDLAKKEFTSMITHELKAPLVPIQGYCQMFLDGALGDLTQEQREKIEIMYDSAVSLAQLIQDLLDVHKLELGKFRFGMGDASAKDLIDETIKRFKPIAEARNIRLAGRIEQELNLTCDPERILQVLNNLVSNALKFVPDHSGRIEIYARRDNDSLLFSVKDNGIGIPKDKQQNLFRKFYQVDTSLQGTGGSGLGLAICKGIVEAHGGRIWVESEGGKGSAFCFSIPRGRPN